METDYKIPEPLLFNPIKHHLGFIKEFINLRTDSANYEIQNLIRELKHIGTSVMDIYRGSLSIRNICNEIEELLYKKDILNKISYSDWTGTNIDSFRTISLTDGSQWTLKYYNNNLRFVHIFPARLSPHTFRIKSNTLKSAILYIILVGKNYVTEEDLNSARVLAGLSPVKEVADTEAITEMIEILRVSG